MAMREIRYREALREALREEMERDERVFLMGEEVGHYQGPTRSARACSSSSVSAGSSTRPSPRRASRASASAPP
jgi:hypothetical protein